MGMVMSSRLGVDFTVPLKPPLSRSSQAGTPRRSTASSASLIRTTFLDFSFTATTSPTFTWKLGMLTLRALTRKCPWRTNWRASARVSAKPSRKTTLSRRCSRNWSRFSPVLPLAALRRPAAVVRDGSDVADQRDLEAGRGQRAQRRLAARAGSLHHHRDVLEAMLHRLGGGVARGHLRGERRRLARALEAARAGGRP